LIAVRDEAAAKLIVEHRLRMQSEKLEKLNKEAEAARKEREAEITRVENAKEVLLYVKGDTAGAIDALVKELDGKELHVCILTV
jgi:translation initiation factor IF-2